MASLEQSKEGVVFGLDIGTRSVVGTVGFMKDGRFHVIAQKVQKHETRAMLDGQIHDIGKVGMTIRNVKDMLEQETDIHLTDVCIAAAGRVLHTVQTTYDEEYPEGHEVTDEDIYNLDSRAVQKAYAEFLEQNTSDMKFYLVGYSTMHYYLNGYQIANLEGHKAGKVSVDLIATFLPDDVVDGLYKACERAELQVANLTLEPIAAIMVAIPEKFRMLNLALIDVGAGTSDTCITDDGTITAYGMIPVAGDHLTEMIAQHCLVDFNTADQIKIDASHMDKVEYTDIMGLKKTITSKEVQKIIRPLVESMAQQVTEQIRKLNGDKPVSAVFVVGGGGRIPEYTKQISKDMGIAEERVALRGEEVMKDIVFLQDDGIERDSLMVTPLGICISFYEECNNFVFVSFNGQQTKLYDNGRLAIVDAAMQASFPNEDLFPKRGQELSFLVNGEQRIVRGEPGEAAVITLNGKPADIHTRIHGNDMIGVQQSTAGAPGEAMIEALPEFKSTFHVVVNGKDVQASRFATVNGQPQTAFYEIQQDDDVHVLDYDTAAQIAKLMDIELTPDTVIRVNNEKADGETPDYENFKVEFGLKEDDIMDSYKDFPDADEIAVEDENAEAFDNAEDTAAADSQAPSPAPASVIKNILVRDLHVTVNDRPVVMHGKTEYIFVDVFDYIDFDLSQPNGRSIVTQLNGDTPDYMQQLHEGDRIEVYWKENR